LGRELVSISLGCLWIIIGTLIVALCVGVWFGGRLATSVLEEIGDRDFSGPTQRINKYESFFSSLSENGYVVIQSNTNILMGKATYPWTIQPQGSSERRTFQWEHDLETNVVYPRTNAALCLDVALGYVSAQDAAAYDGFSSENEKYDPDDLITKAMVQNNFSLIPAPELSAGWERGDESTAAVSPGLVSPEEGAGRRDAERKAQEEAAEESKPSDPNDATDVVSGDDTGSSTDSPSDDDDNATAVE
jgi:hypothetical protein